MKLSDLCRYYLRCLSVAYQDGVVVGQCSDSDYIELAAHPACNSTRSNLLEYPGVSALVNRTQRGLPRKNLVLGYPICRMRESHGKGWSDVLKPIFVSEIHFTVSEEDGGILLAEENLTLNPGAVAMLDTHEKGDVMAATVALVEELGLDREKPPALEELCVRIRVARPFWPWCEDIDPADLSQRGSLGSLSQNGVYNRVAILAAEPSDFIRGLEEELADMEKLSEDAIDGTALDAWLRRDFSGFQNPPGAGMGLLEPLPLNLEQREAVERALSQPLTVVTGPPGTGKSQVVSTILINAAVRGMRVLFSSRNNKAVDVVEERVNDLGSLPVLLRMGTGNYQQKLQTHLIGLLGSRVAQQDLQAFEEAQSDYQKLETRGIQIHQRAEKLIDLRNRVDRAEQKVEAIRGSLANEGFHSLRGEDSEELRNVAAKIIAAAGKADRSVQPWLIRWIWIIVRRNRMSVLEEAVSRAQGLLARVHVSSPGCPVSDASVRAWADVGEKLVLRAEQTRSIAEYFRLLGLLSNGDRLEVFMAALDENQREKALVSKRVWDGWLRVMPSRLSPQTKDDLAGFAAVLKTIIQAQAAGDRAPASTWSSYFHLIPKVSSFLPCWAVTALSVHKRFPFAGGSFDLLVIDEAGQCDIAAVLPLLYRVKAVVIIGDPKQLQNISPLPAALDASLLAAHGLSNHPIWGYSLNSVYDLAASLADSRSIVQLRDHHRSHADIIGFADGEFYGGSLRIATNHEDLLMIDPNLSAIQWIDLTGRVTRDNRDGIFNQAEARKVVEVLERLVIVRNYCGSVGVVTPFRGQANLIRRMIKDKPALDAALNRGSCLVETAHRFQGDERDVMVFSPVVSAGISNGALNFLRRGGNVFNVAVTRARAGLIVVGDKGAARNSGISHLASLVGYVERLAGRDAAQGFPTVSNPQFVSEWEKVFYKAFQDRGIALIPQYDVDKYILDFALFKNHRKLNIEIDGEQYHRDWNGDLLQRDLLRNTRLRELGWDVVRFWVYEVRDELELCLQRVEKWIESAEL